MLVLSVVEQRYHSITMALNEAAMISQEPGIPRRAAWPSWKWPCASWRRPASTLSSCKTLGSARLIRSDDVRPRNPRLDPDVDHERGGRGAARELGCSRIILARELALPEISRIREAIDFPVEVFVHGALCVAYSGQCLTSEALGGRSANRGECAQACRMPYEIICDGQLVDLEDVQYLLSPRTWRLTTWSLN